MSGAYAAGWTVTKPAISSSGGIVTAQNRKAAAVGADVLAAGGNAVDAALATSLALGATEPWMSGLGGGGCMLVWPADAASPTAIDFGMVSPAGLDPDAYPLTGETGAELFGWPAVQDDRNLQGPHAVCTPTLLAGMALAHDRFGTMPWAGLFTPAVELARQGLEIDWFASLVIGNGARELARHAPSRAVWLPGGFPPSIPYAGDPTFLPLGRLADTLATLAADGPPAFYHGAIGEALCADVQAAGGTLGREDLADYAARTREALPIAYRGARLFGMPGLFAGASFARCLELMAERDLGQATAAELYGAYAAALQRAYAERLAGMGAGNDAAEQAAPSCTSHFCIVDRQGMLVTVTQTLLSLFGSKLVSPSTGLLLNNGIMWFDPRPGRPNSIGPGKRPLSNMCPVVGELHDGAPRRMALGASGGRRILPAVLQLVSFLVDRGLNLHDAFHQPRVDLSGGEVLTVNPALDPAARTALGDAFTVREMRPAVYPTLYACPTAVLRELQPGRNWGAAEPVQPWAGPVAET